MTHRLRCTGRKRAFNAQGCRMNLVIDVEKDQVVADAHFHSSGNVFTSYLRAARTSG